MFSEGHDVISVCANSPTSSHELRAGCVWGYAYYKAGLAGQWPVFRVLSAIGRRMARQRWPMAEDPLSTLHCSILGITSLVTKLSLREEKKNWSKLMHFRSYMLCNG